MSSFLFNLARYYQYLTAIPHVGLYTSLPKIENDVCKTKTNLMI